MEEVPAQSVHSVDVAEELHMPCGELSFVADRLCSLKAVENFVKNCKRKNLLPNYWSAFRQDKPPLPVPTFLEGSPVF
jgi:hypothetical protein